MQKNKNEVEDTGREKETLVPVLSLIHISEPTRR